RGFAMFWSYPLALHDSNRMVAPERSFLWINRNDWKRQIGLRIRLDHHAFIKHCRRKILGTVRKHLAPEESGRASIMHNALFDASHEQFGLRSRKVVQREPCRFSRRRISLGKE